MLPRRLCHLRFALAVAASLSAAALTSCSSPASPVAPDPTGLTQNWQIQTGASVGTSAGSSIFLAGALSIQGSQVTGAFATKASPCMGPQQVDPFTGTYNASTGALVLNTPYGVLAQLAVAPLPTTLSTGTLGGGGYLCEVVTGPIASVGMEIPALTGSFNGKVASPDAAATAVLALAQAPTASSDATFALTGTLQFTSTTCSASIPVTGAIGGAAYQLTSTSPGVTLSGLDNVGGAKLPTATIAFANGPCNSGTAATFTGDLNHQ